MPTRPFTLMLLLLGSLLPCGILAQPSIVSVNGRQLLVQKRLPDGTTAPAAPYIIRGVNWSPASTNTLTSPTDPENVNRRRPEFAKWAPIDLPLIRTLNANTIRVPMDFGVGGAGEPNGRAVLDACYTNGIMVVMTVDNGVNDLARIRGAVTFYRDHPAILLWCLGNEWNINRYYGVASTVENAAQRTQSAARLIKTLDTNHPVVSSYGEIDIDQPGLRLADTARYVNEFCTDVDIWALNIYRGKTFGSLFAQWAGITSRPLFLGEFGVDAFHSTTPVNPNPTGTLDENAQAEWNVALWQNLARNLSAADPHHVAIGGLVHEFNDEWWKIAPATSQQTGGLISATGFPDGMASEEIFGLCDIFRRPRAAYEALRNEFLGNDPGTGTIRTVTTTANSGPGSLRQVISEAKAGDTITFNLPTPATITFGSQVRLTNDLVIAGPGTNRLTFNGGAATRLFTVVTGTVVRISGVTFTRGSAAELGGAIDNRGLLELVDCRFINNFAGTSGDGFGQGGAVYSTRSLVVKNCAFTGNGTSGNGGAIRSSGDLAVQESFFASNRANYFGGAIYNFGSALIGASYLTNNSAGPAGGGIWNENSGLSLVNSTLAQNSAKEGGALANKNGTLYVSQCTLSGNTATSGGAGIFNGVFNENGGTLMLSGSTVVSNTTAGTTLGGGLRIAAGSFTMRSSIVAGNRPNDCSGTILSGGYNLLANDSGAIGLSSGVNEDQSGTATAPLNPLLGSLTDNGGPAPTHALSHGSPALDRGKNFARTADQRGEARFDQPDLPNATNSDGADIGACEASQPRLTSISTVSDSVRVEFTTLLGRQAVLQTRTAFDNSAWSNSAPIPGTGGKIFADIPFTPADRFFRVTIP